MPDNDSLNYDPQNFVTPGQIEANRAYAQALLKQGLGGAPTNVSNGITFASPFGIGSAGLQGYLGRQGLDQAGAAERSNINTTGSAASLTPPNAPGTQGTPGTIQGAGQSAGLSSTPLASAYANETKTQESHGNYGTIGPATRDGDHAYGAYQVKGSNIPQWTAEVLGKPMTAQEFLANPQAQDAVYQRKFGQLVQKYGPEGAARAWYGGEGNVNNPGARDLAHPNAPTVGQYGQNFVAGLPQGADPGSQALAFNGGPSGAPSQAPGAPSPMATALSAPRGDGGAQPAQPPMGLPGMVPNTGGSPQQMIPGNLLPGRQQVTQQQLQNILHAAAVNPENQQIQAAAKYAMESYYGQYQPQSVGIPGGNLIYDPRTKQQMPLYSIENGSLKAGDVESPFQYQTKPDGKGGYVRTIIPTQSPGGAQQPPPQAGPQGAPVAPQGAPQSPGGAPGAAPGGAPSQIPSIGPPLKFSGDDEGTSIGPGEAPDIITKGPEAVKGDAGAALANQPPSQALSFAETKTTPGAPSGVGGAAPDLYNMSPGELANWSQQRQINTEASKEFNKQDIEGQAKDFDSLQKIQQNAYNLDTQINMAKSIVQDPRFIQGPGADLKLGWNKALTFLGDEKSEQRVALSNAFDKLIASNVLADMRSKLEGLGQVRLAEINLLNQSTASKYNTVGANMAILDVADRFQKQAEQMGNVANLYMQGQRWDAQGNPVQGNTGDRPTRAGMQQVVNSYLANHPLFSKEEIADYTQRFKDDKAASAGQVPLPPGAKLNTKSAPQ